jgi:hypothetical protein
LYYKNWIGIIESFLTLFEADMNQVTKIDIALDGCNHIQKFVNDFWYKKLENVERIGRKSTTESQSKQAGFFPYKFDEVTREISTVYVGSASSEKRMKIYNKTTELESSNKYYIQEFWKSNGLNTDSYNYRIELSCKSGIIKQIKDFDWRKLDSSNYLASIFYTFSYNLIGFVQKDNKRLDRSTKINLIDFEKLNSQKLEKVTKKEVTDRHKAKQEIHFVKKQSLLNLIDKNTYETISGYIDNLVNRFNLERWLNKKEKFWETKYKNMNRNEEIVFELILENTDYWKSYFKEKDKVNEALTYQLEENLIYYYRQAREKGFTAKYESFRKFYYQTIERDFDKIFEISI